MSTRPSPLIPLTGLILFSFLAVPVTAQVKEVADSQLAAPAVLAKLLPTVDGWTRSEPRLNQIDSDGCTYTLASATYSTDSIRIKLTLADTARHAETLAILASAIVNLPDNYEGKVPPATTIKRSKTDNTRASEMWDADKLSGEIVVVAAGRFVVQVESQKADSLDSLHLLLKAVDLKALASLK